MALLGFWGFDHLVGGQNMNTLPGWVSTGGTMTLIAGQLGGFALNLNNNNPIYTYQTGGTYSTLVLGFRFRHRTPGSVLEIARFMDSTSAQLTLNVNTSNKLVVKRGGTTLATGATSLVHDAWYYIEFKATFHGSTGAYEVRLDEAVELTATGVNTISTANAYATGFSFGNTSFDSTSHGWDDTYLLDTSGGAPYNNYLGIVRVETLLPTASDGSPQWTPNASTNVSRVNQAQPDDDTTYNSDSTSGHIDLYTHGSLSGTPAQIYAVAVSTYARKDDASARQIKNKFKSGGTTVAGAALSLVTTYSYARDYWITDPDTSAAWASAAAVNATSIGYEVV